MKKFLIILAAIGVAGSAFAGQVTKTAQTAKTIQAAKIKCPVMTTQTVDIAKATKAKMFADYKGRRYFFCCPGCPAAFKKNPAKFAKAPSIPTPKKKV